MKTTVSMVADATSTATRDTDAAKVVSAIRSDRYAAPVAEIRATYNEALAESDGRPADAKRAVDHCKKALPGILWSGTFSRRGMDHLQAHSGLLCADIDDLDGDRLGEVRDKLESDPHAFAVFLSPTGSGLKAVFRVPADASRQRDSFNAVREYVRELCGVALDEACKDVARLCFVSHDPDAYLNVEATELDVPESRPTVSDGKAAAPADLSRRQRIAGDLLGEITWTDEARGLCLCPGQSRHTTGDGTRDCEVHLDGAPTIHCLHNSCGPVIEAMNRELRSRIGRAEQPVPRLNGVDLHGCGGNRIKTTSADSTVRWPAPMHEAAFHGLAGEVVRMIEPHTEAAPEALLVMFVSAFGNLLGSGPHFLAEARPHPARIWPVLVGETAKGRKGSAWSSLRFVLEKVADRWCADRLMSGLSSGEGLIWAVRDPIERVKRGKDGEETKVVEDEGVRDKRLMVTEEEFSSVLKVAGREGNIISDILRRAWDDGKLRTLTKNSPAQATGAHITVIGHITKGELGKLLTQTDSINGFGNRFLWVAVKRSKLLPDGGGLHMVDLASLVYRLRGALDRGRLAGMMPRTEAARRFWHDLYPVLSGDRPGLLGAITNRAEAQVMRLALVYAVLDGREHIDTPHLRAALAVWDYCERSARHIFGDSFGDSVTDTLLEELRAAGETGVTKEQIRDLFGRNAKGARIDVALETLRRFGFATAEKRKNPAGSRGRPATIWRYAVNKGNDLDDENTESSAETPDDENDVYDLNRIASLQSFLSSGEGENGETVVSPANDGGPTRHADREAAIRV